MRSIFTKSSHIPIVTIGILALLYSCSEKKPTRQLQPGDLENTATTDVETTDLPWENQAAEPLQATLPVTRAEPELDIAIREPPLAEKSTEPVTLPEMEIEEPPQALLELALETYNTATNQWKEGRLEQALIELDQTYALILKIDAEKDPDALQGKEDLRYLISKRIVEIHTAQRTVVGDINKAIPLIINEEVQKEIRSFQTRERGFFLRSYARSGKYRPMILAALRRQGIPEQLSWLPLIESGFVTSALSRARALGLWQFIPSTGYRYGLNRNQWIDERMDPEKATTAAIAYLLDLHNLFGDWLSALAAYNCGERRVLNAINSQKINYLDDFWDLYRKLPRETARYVPRFLATMAILQDPEKYGFELPQPNQPPSFDTIESTRSVKLADLDRLAGLSKGSLKALNPELRYGITPAKAYTLKIPSGHLKPLREGWASLPVAQPPLNHRAVHRVRSGETLSTIAQRYRTSVTKIVRTNGLSNQHRIWPGQRLKIPGRYQATRRTKNRGGTTSSLTHRVVAGDSLWRLAQKYGTTVNQIRARNNLKGNHLTLGQRLVIKSGTAGPSRTYKVKRGDTLAQIAQRHGVKLRDLLAANRLNSRDRIFPNQTLVVP